MMRFHAYEAAACALAAIVLAGCGSGSQQAAGSGYVPKKQQELKSAVLPAGQEAAYFPFTKGNQWTYTTETTQVVSGRAAAPITQTITYRMTDVVTQPDGAVDATCEIVRNDKVVDKQVWRMAKDGLYEVALGSKLNKFSSPQLVLPFPPKANDTHKWQGTIVADTGETRKATNSLKVLGEQIIDTDMGSFKAMAVNSGGTLKSPTTDSEIASLLWLIPNVGIGRYRQEARGTQTLTEPKYKGQKVPFTIVQVMKLKNYSLKK